LKRLRMIATSGDEIVFTDFERLTRLAHGADLTG
jgi:hypothetical protein